ncbi:D-ribose-binding periplasmic protein precursor [Aquimixticola soesokkakensis]|uniref:D-ribose-binding periplasmic protein n=1 Tax=Aquimixticola soesokkakensis TaxID=1519096 RepID=A0A1Y5TBD1_9RHOB|nr:substrate-binding domain-containing protein [Aquimixticola soesokkakensis]SLN60231.1 D-ribose-binding periplasmic protein precursor [Aquimixticola soesokkakensis]
MTSARTATRLMKTCTACVALIAAIAATPGAQAADPAKSIAFSPIALDIPAMQGLSGAVEHFAQDAGIGFVSLDPKFDPGQQAQQLSQVIETGKVQGAWSIVIRAAALRGVVKTAIDKNVALVVSGRPADYGLDGPQPGIAFSDINYEDYGASLADQLAQCITEKLDGSAQVLFFGDSSGTKAAELTDNAAKAALASGAPQASIVATAISLERLESQQKAAQMLQSKPDATAVYAANDENAMGAITAFRAAGKDLPCVVSGGGGAEALEAVSSGDLYAVAGFDFEGDAHQNFETLVSMMEDPTTAGPILEIPIKVTK